MDHDVIVIGGGPAGLAAATWLARYRAGVLVLDDGRHRNRWVERSHGYLGSDPVAPQVLLERARAGLSAYPEAVIESATARGARLDGDHVVVDVDGRAVTARRLVVATGVADVFPDVGGFFEHYGADVFHCSACDGYDARDKPVVVFGWGEHVAGFAFALLRWARSIAIVTGGHAFDGDAAHRAALTLQGIEVIEDRATELVGPRGGLESVVLSSGRELPCEMAFFSIEHRPASDLAVRLGCRQTDEGCTWVDGEGRTSQDLVFAAGDVVPGLQLVQVAASKGAVAGVGCARSLAPQLEL